MRRPTLALTVFAGLALIGPLVYRHNPVVIWNATKSSPIGLYRVVSGEPGHGSLAVISLPEPYRRLAQQRGYLPRRTLLIKPIAAVQGDVVCRRGQIVSVNGRVVALARNLDFAGRPLPRWGGCRLLAAMLLAIASQPESFDSRYFGPIPRVHVVGLAVPIFVRRP